MQQSTEQSSEFITLLQANKGILYKVAKTYCYDEEGQKDLIQEISLQIWKSFSGYDPSYKFSTWLYRVALNVAISHLRKESKRQEINKPFQEGFIQFSLPDEDPMNEKVAQLYTAIGELNVLNKALMLLYLEEKNYSEIAEIMGISETNVATKLSRIKKVIKEKLLKLNQL